LSRIAEPRPAKPVPTITIRWCSGGPLELDGAGAAIGSATSVILQGYII